ncbi:MAG: biotin transporter BioY [Gemmatimonadetes bacterium]|nr:biotin transporter BioY [Gemmatimonadota bacterium]
MTTTQSVAAAAAPTRSRTVRLAAAALGALVVALAAQFAVPLPGTPVPMTLQPLAVLIVGGLLGPRYGALSLALYLAMGAAGLPVFTPFGAPGLARLFGPTGGYLLAYPLAAAVVGWVVRRSGGPAVSLDAAPLTARPPVRLTALAAFLGLATIHAGGLAQLLALTGHLERAVAAGTLPFLLGDLIKVLVAALVLHRGHSLSRALS